MIPPTREVFRGKWVFGVFWGSRKWGTRIAPNSGFPTCHIQRQYAEDTQWHLLGEDSPDDTRPAGLCYRVFFVGEFGEKRRKKRGGGTRGARGAAAHGYAGPGKAENTSRVSCPRALSKGSIPRYPGQETPSAEESNGGWVKSRKNPEKRVPADPNEARPRCVAFRDHAKPRHYGLTGPW